MSFRASKCTLRGYGPFGGLCAGIDRSSINHLRHHTSMARMIPRLLMPIWVFSAFSLAALQAAPQRGTAVSVPDGFPLSAWLTQKEISQIYWRVYVSKPYFRPDLRQELTVTAH